LTSAGQRGDAARCRELGISVYLIKPLRQSELLEAMLAALGKSPAPGSRAAVITRHTLRENRRKLNVLLAEDNAVNQQLAVRLLEKYGHIVTVASNGHSALDLLKKAKFDLVLMDVQMPVMDGFQATAAIRQEEASSGKHLPIVAMTAHTMAGDRERCLQAGMDAYISKPIGGDELNALVEQIVQLGSISPPQPPQSAAAAVLDTGEALNRLQGDKELLADLAEVFLRDYPAQLADLRNSLDCGDARGLSRAAHSLKGSVANFGARRVFEAALELEKTANGGDLAGCTRPYAALRAELDMLLPELERLGKIEV